jgi:hypothetical protein
LIFCGRRSDHNTNVARAFTMTTMVKKSKDMWGDGV